MKLVEILAKKLSEWKEDAHIAMQDNDSDKTIWFLEKDHEFVAHNGFEWRCDSYFKIMISRPGGLASDYKDAIVTKEQWQAERDRQKGGEWKRHRGGKCPVDSQTVVEIRQRNGDIEKFTANGFMWDHNGQKDDIMSYRVISQPQAEEVEVNDTTIGTLSYKVEVDTSAAAQAIDALAAKLDQVDGPLRWRDCVNELDAYIEEFTREREALINRLAVEGFALIPAMTAVMGVSDDMNFWESWRVGDIIKVTNDHDIDDGQYAILEIEDAGYEGELPVKTCKGWPDTEYATLEFVRRP